MAVTYADRIVIVTADPVMADELTTLLRRAGWHVGSVVGTLEQAALDLVHRRVDLVVIDMRLACSDPGFWAAELIAGPLSTPTLLVAPPGRRGGLAHAPFY